MRSLYSRILFLAGLEKDASLRAPSKQALRVKKRFLDDIVGRVLGRFQHADIVEMPNVGNTPEDIRKNVAFLKKKIIEAVRHSNVKGSKNIVQVVKDTPLVYDLPSMHSINPYAKDVRKVVHVGDVPVSRRDFRPLRSNGYSAWYNSYFTPGEGVSKKQVKRLSELFNFDPEKPLVYFPSGRSKSGKPVANIQTLLHEFGHAFDDVTTGIENEKWFVNRGNRRVLNPYGRNTRRGKIPIAKLLRDERLLLSLDPTLRQEFAASLAGGGNKNSRTFRGILTGYRLDRAVANYGRHMGLSDIRELLRQAKNIWANPTNMTYDELMPLRVGWGKRQDAVTKKLEKEFGNG